MEIKVLYSFAYFIEVQKKCLAIKLCSLFLYFARLVDYNLLIILSSVSDMRLLTNFQHSKVIIFRLAPYDITKN